MQIALGKIAADLQRQLGCAMVSTHSAITLKPNWCAMTTNACARAISSELAASRAVVAFLYLEKFDLPVTLT